MDISAEKGVIRGNNILLTLRCPDLGARQIDVFLKEQDGERKAFQLRWPDDFSVAVQADDGLPVGTASIPEVDGLPIFSDVILREAGAALPTGEGWHLAGLNAFSERQFERRFFRKKHRVNDRETLTYSLKTILNNYRLNEGHRCVVAVIFGYRAVDSGDPEELLLAKRHLQSQKQRHAAAGLPTTTDVRTDREHLYISMLTALWHVDLALAHDDDFLGTLDEALAFSKTIAAPMTTTSYNLSRAALLRGWLHLKAGDQQRAIEAHEYNFEFYRKSLSSLERKTIHFIEQRETHEIVAMSLQASDKISAGTKNFSADRVFALACRTRSEQAVERLQARFQRLSRSLG